MRQHLEPVGDGLPEELADLDLEEMVARLSIEPAKPIRRVAAERAEHESQPVFKPATQDPYQFMASMTDEKPVENPEQETTTATPASSQKMSRRGTNFNFRRPTV